jgi:hypothetical protein
MNDLVEARTVAPAAACDWPVTNCYIDAWLSILRAWRMEPIAALGVTVTQDYEGDQFTFFKYLHEDLERLYGVVVGELSIWLPLHEHIQQQVQRGRLVLAEVDGYYLPDTRATSYRMQHVKTTIGVDAMNGDGGWLRYFHNDGYYELSGEDYAGLFDKAAEALPPYVEFVKRRWPPLHGPALTEAAVELMRRHLHRRPEESPIRRYRAEFPARMEWLEAHPDRFHEYAFNNFRQLGANHQLLARHVAWLRTCGIGGLDAAYDAAAAISAAAKAMQFKAARIANKHRFDPCIALFDTMEQNYAAAMQCLDRVFG